MLSGIDNYLTSYMKTARESTKVDESEKVDTFANQIRQANVNFPYSSLAKDGAIEYNGVVFIGDSKTNSINLGDVSDKNNVLRIQLSGGGFLNVNFDSIGQLKNALGMFSGKDQGIILKAISTHHFEQGFVKAAEDEEEETVKKIGEENSEAEPMSEAEVAMNMMMGTANPDEGKIKVGPSQMEVLKWEA